MRSALLFAAMASSLTVLAANDASPEFVFPLIAKYGGVVALPQAAEPPRAATKLVLDIVSDSKPEEVNKGIEAAARYLNLNAQAGLTAKDVTLALVLHGGATKAALDDQAYATQTGAKQNPNLPLIATLRQHGVTVYVCGQSLARNRYPLAQVAADVTVATSALTVNVNKQRDGYAYVAIH